jgi:hypothetical protein
MDRILPSFRKSDYHKFRRCQMPRDPAKNPLRFEASGDQKYLDKARWRGKVGWDATRRQHMALLRTGSAGWCLGLFPDEAASSTGKRWRSCRAGLGEGENEKQATQTEVVEDFRTGPPEHQDFPETQRRKLKCRLGLEKREHCQQ